MDSAHFAEQIRAHQNPASTNRRGAERDAWILRLAQIGPIWTAILVLLGLFPSRQTAERRMRKLEKSGRLRYAGGVTLAGYRRSHVWCNRGIPGRMLRHETDLMRFFFAYWPHAYALTGADVDPRWRADMELTIGDLATGRRYLVEIDEGTETLGQVRTRLVVYRECPHAVLFVTRSASRVSEVLRLTDNPRIYATTLESCLRDPWGDHWRNVRSERGRIDCPGGEAGIKGS